MSCLSALKGFNSLCMCVVPIVLHLVPFIYKDSAVLAPSLPYSMKKLPPSLFAGLYRTTGFISLLLLCACLPGISNAAPANENRLRAELEAATTDTLRCRLYGELAWELKFTNNTEAYSLAAEEIKLANNNPLRLADAYRTQALVKVINNELSEGLRLYQIAIDNARKAKSELYEASCLSLIAGMYQDLGDYDQALHYYFEGLKVAEQGKEQKMVATLYNNIASVYGSAGYDPQFGLTYYRRALNEANRLKNYAFGALVASNMASVYMDARKQDSAEIMIVEALANNKASGTHGYEYAVTLTNVGEIYSRLKKYAEAEAYLKEAIAIQDSLKRPINVLGPVSILCNLYINNNKIAEAKTLADRLITTAREYNTKLYLREGYKLMSDIARRQGNTAQALDYYEQYSAWNDSVFNETREQSLANVRSRAELAQKELEVQYETGKKTQENQILKLQNNNLRIGVIGAIMAVALISLLASFIYKGNKAKEAANKELTEKNTLIEKQSKEKDILMQEIHHRVKNNLQIVSSLLNLQANSISDGFAKDALRESHNRVKSIALIHQKLYMQEDLSAISLQEYVLQLCAHLKTVFNANLVNINCSVYPPHLKLSMETSIPLGVILNELVTNSIKYGQINREGGQINIAFIADGGGFCTLQFSDNGVGMPQQFDIKKSNSLGLKIVQELSRQLKGTLNYVAAPENAFTLVFPLQKT